MTADIHTYSTLLRREADGVAENILHRPAEQFAISQNLDRRRAIEFQVAAPRLRFDARIVDEIANQVVERMGLSDVAYDYTGGTRGWKGDVPVVRFNSDKLAARGWRCQHSSREALMDSIDSNIREAQRRVRG